MYLRASNCYCPAILSVESFKKMISFIISLTLDQYIVQPNYHWSLPIYDSSGLLTGMGYHTQRGLTNAGISSIFILPFGLLPYARSKSSALFYSKHLGCHANPNRKRKPEGAVSTARKIDCQSIFDLLPTVDTMPDDRGCRGIAVEIRGSINIWYVTLLVAPCRLLQQNPSQPLCH